MGGSTPFLSAEIKEIKTESKKWVCLSFYKFVYLVIRTIDKCQVCVLLGRTTHKRYVCVPL